jgi:hypothetical protein
MIYPLTSLFCLLITGVAGSFGKAIVKLVLEGRPDINPIGGTLRMVNLCFQLGQRLVK